MEKKATEITIGSLVKLKSGGMLMTVGEIPISNFYTRDRGTPATAVCHWFDGSNTYFKEPIPLASLVLVDAESQAEDRDTAEDL